MSPPPKLSIVIPIWNEESWIRFCYIEIKNHLIENDIDAQLIFASDGCTDKTVEIINEIKSEDDSIIHYNSEDRLGRGLALNRVIKECKTPYILYMDSDLATNLNHLIEILNSLEGNYDIVVGSRLLKESETERSRIRTLFSRTYNFLVRLLFRSRIKDHQCGFKGFKHEKIVSLLPEVKSNGWFWDTELLIRSQKKGLKIKEIPVRWKDREKSESKVSLVNDSQEMFFSLLKLRWNLYPIWFKHLIKFGLVGILNTSLTLLTLYILDITIGRGVLGYPFAYAVGIITSFLLNRAFTFKKKGWTKATLIQLFGFSITAILGMVLYSGLAYLLETYANFYYILAAICATIINFLFQFVLSKFLIFK